jgi:hypothetical protein
MGGVGAPAGAARVAPDADNGSADDGRSPMKNVEMSLAGNILTITVDLSKEFGPSSSGKTIIVASTEGNVTVPEREEKIGLNVYRKK